MNVGDKVPHSIHFDSTDPCFHQFSDHNNRGLVLYFYPKDNTPGCTLESQDFRDLYTKFQALNIQIVGISRDSISSHQKFIDKHALPFPLISDKEETLCRLFEVIKLKKMYGKESMGIERSTFLIDSKGIICQSWRKVKVKNHAQQVLEYIEKNQE